MKIFIVFITLLGNLVLSHASDYCPSKTNKKEIKSLIHNILVAENIFPKLRPLWDQKRLKLVEFQSNAYYLKTGPGPILKNKNKRLLKIFINTKLYQCAPTKKALKAILIHELAHLDDYLQKSVFKIGLKMLRRKSRARYERATDLRVLELGHHQGLKEYRKWIYSKLTKKELKKKKCFYYTPQEIDDHDHLGTEAKSYFKKYCQRGK